MKKLFKSDFHSICGYICIAAMIWVYLVQPIATYILSIFNIYASVSPTNMYDLIILMGGLLGIGTAKTMEFIMTNRNNGN